MLHVLPPTFEAALQQNNKVARFLLLGGKTRNIAIQLVWSKVAKQVARFCSPFYAVP